MSATREAWMKLHANYYIDADVAFSFLLMDASDFLHGAHGIVQCLSDALTSPEAETVDTDHLSCALAGIAALIQMGHRCMALAHGRMMVQGLHRHSDLH